MRGNSKLKPWARASTIAAGSPLTRASNRWTVFRGERRAGRSSMRAIDTKQDRYCELDRFLVPADTSLARPSPSGPAIGRIANENVRGSRIAPAGQQFWNTLLTAQLRIREIIRIESPCQDFARGRFHGQ